MIDMTWMKEHIGSIDEAISLSNKFYWNIEIKQVNNTWMVLGGEKVILQVDNQETLEAFLYGLGLAYSVFSPLEIERFREENPYDK